MNNTQIIQNLYAAYRNTQFVMLKTSNKKLSQELSKISSKLTRLIDEIKLEEKS